MMKNPRILAVDDDPGFLRSLSNLLTYKKYQVETLTDPFQVEVRINQEDFDCLLIDVKMPDLNGIELLKKIQSQKPHLPVLMLSGESGTETIVEAIKLGAYDFIDKPIDPDRLLVSIRNALERRHLYLDREALIAQLEETHLIIGKSPQLLEAVEQAKKIAPFNDRVLITGESGTGKELIAQLIRHHSTRNTKPFIKVNCAAIPSELLESDLFGHLKGAFTGATRDQKGKFILADQGTLFLDEIGDLPLPLQGKLLTVLEDGMVPVIGKEEPVKVDVRVIAATNQDLKQLVKENRFRKDLYYRLNVFHIHLPPLRERKEDIPLLAEFFMKQYAQSHNKILQEISPGAMMMLQSHDWPGNVRELKNVINKLAIFANSPIIQSEDIARVFNLTEQTFQNIQTIPGLEEAREQFERDYIIKIFEQTGGRMIETAKILKMNRSSLYKKMIKLGIYSDLKS